MQLFLGTYQCDSVSNYLMVDPAYEVRNHTTRTPQSYPFLWPISERKSWRTLPVFVIIDFKTTSIFFSFASCFYNVLFFHIIHFSWSSSSSSSSSSSYYYYYSSDLLENVTISHSILVIRWVCREERQSSRIRDAAPAGRRRRRKRRRKQKRGRRKGGGGQGGGRGTNRTAATTRYVARGRTQTNVEIKGDDRDSNAPDKVSIPDPYRRCPYLIDTFESENRGVSTTMMTEQDAV